MVEWELIQPAVQLHKDPIVQTGCTKTGPKKHWQLSPSLCKGWGKPTVEICALCGPLPLWRDSPRPATQELAVMEAYVKIYAEKGSD